MQVERLSRVRRGGWLKHRRRPGHASLPETPGGILAYLPDVRPTEMRWMKEAWSIWQLATPWIHIGPETVEASDITARGLGIGFERM